MEIEPSTWIVTSILIAMTGQMFVHGIVQHFADAMMQRAFVRAADIHAGFFADGFETFKFSELRRAIIAP